MRDRDFWIYSLTGVLFSMLTVRVAYVLFVKFYRPPVQEQTATYKVRARKAVKHKFPNFIRAPGLISERNVAEITSHIPGTVAYIASPGTVMQPGDVIARIIPVDGKSKDQLMLKVKHAKEKLNTEYSASRSQVLAKNPQLPESEVALVVGRISSVRNAQIEHAKAEEELNAHESQTTIKAIHYCKIDTVGVSEGSSVSHNSKLCSIARLDTTDVFVECWVPHNAQAQIHPGQKANFSFRVGGGIKVIPGKVESVGVASKHTLYHGACVTIRMEIPQKHEQPIRLYPPKTPGEASIFVADMEVLAVPEAALDPMRSDVIPGSTNTVLKINKTRARSPEGHQRGFAHFIPVTILARRYGFVAVASDGNQLKDGDTVSIDSVLNLEARAQGQIPVEVIDEGDRSTDYGYDDEGADTSAPDSDDATDHTEGATVSEAQR